MYIVFHCTVYIKLRLLFHWNLLLDSILKSQSTRQCNISSHWLYPTYTHTHMCDCKCTFLCWFVSHIFFSFSYWLPFARYLQMGQQLCDDTLTAVLNVYIIEHYMIDIHTASTIKLQKNKWPYIRNANFSAHHNNIKKYYTVNIIWKIWLLELQ